MRWVLFVLAVVASSFFYWLRSNHRSLYGLSEIVVGLFIFLLLFEIIPQPILLVKDNTAALGLMTNVVAFFTGAYAIVRGLDNIITVLRS
jgi:hypothetical protein